MLSFKIYDFLNLVYLHFHICRLFVSTIDPRPPKCWPRFLICSLSVAFYKLDPARGRQLSEIPKIG
jgi:hypothetical protein